MSKFTKPQKCLRFSFDGGGAREGKHREIQSREEFNLTPAVFTSFVIERDDQAFSVVDLPYHLRRVNSNARSAGICSQCEESVVLKVFSRIFSKFTEASMLRARLVHSELETWISVREMLTQEPKAVTLRAVELERFRPEIKTLVLEESIHAEHSVQKSNADSALLVNSLGNVLETVWANIFWFDKNARLCTTSELGILPGIFRAAILREFPVEQKVIKLSDLLVEAKEIFLTQSVHGIVPVSKICEQVFEVDSGTASMLAWYKQYQNRAEHKLKIKVGADLDE